MMALLLLVEEQDHLPLRSDRALYSAVYIIKKSRDRILFALWRDRQVDQREVCEVQVLSISNEVGCGL
jgi:hypothetical protein